jgi:hypothetical protein
MTRSGVWRYDFEQPIAGRVDTPGGEFARLYFSERPGWVASSGCGVVSAGDDCYFPGLQFLALSLQEKAPFVVFDLGLVGGQREWLLRRGVRVVGVVDDDLLVPRSEIMWQTWNKPAFLAASPFEVSLWIDADCFVVGDLRPLFDVAGEHPLVFRHVDPESFRPENGEGLYNRWPVEGRRLAGGVQAAVVGVANGRDRGLVDTWGKACAQFREPDHARHVRCWDQGALLWAVEKLGLGWCARPSEGWNRFCFPNAAFGLGTVEAFFNSFAAGVGDVILHFVGRPKFWVNWGKFLPL